MAAIRIKDPAVWRADIEIRLVQLGRGARRHRVDEIELTDSTTTAERAGAGVDAQKKRAIDESEGADVIP